VLAVALMMTLAATGCGDDDTGSGASTSAETATSSTAVSTSSTSVPPTGPFTADEMAKIDAAAAASLTNGVTGTIVSIDDPQRGTILKAYGTADTAGTPMSPELYYRIGSVTKTLTADAVLRLVDQGEVALSDPMSKYVDDLPYGDQVTIQDLLAMRSGMYDFANDTDFFNRYIADPTLPWTVDETLAIIRDHAAEATPPNQATAYVNSNFVILGLVIEKVTGQTVAEHLNGLIRELGLNDTSFPTDDDMPEPYAHGYYSDGKMAAPAGGYRDVSRQSVVIPWSAGAVISTVPDMTRYARQLATGFGLKPETWQLRQTFTPITTTGVKVQYGLGITQLGEWIGHDGSLFGYSTMVFHLPSNGATVVVMGNAADEIVVVSQQLFGEIAKLLYPGSLTTW
jgi:Beta-lactamase class C and other penicillin binding proteins